MSFPRSENLPVAAGGWSSFVARKAPSTFLQKPAEGLLRDTNGYLCSAATGLSRCF